jgi:hypothetical protein
MDLQEKLALIKQIEQGFRMQQIIDEKEKQDILFQNKYSEEERERILIRSKFINGFDLKNYKIKDNQLVKNDYPKGE